MNHLLKAERPGVEPTTFKSPVQRPNHYTTRPCARKVLQQHNEALEIRGGSFCPRRTFTRRCGSMTVHILYCTVSAHNRIPHTRQTMQS